MKKVFICTLFLVCLVNASSKQEDIITTPLRLTSETLQVLPSKSFHSYQHVVISGKFYEGDLKVLESFSSVKILDLHSAMDIKHIEQMPIMESVERLNLRGRPISDSSLEHLAKVFKSVKEVDLSNTGVLGSGLCSLKGLSHLMILNLSSTLISKKEYVVGLLEALPKLTVYLYDTLIDKSVFTDNPKVIFERRYF